VIGCPHCHSILPVQYINTGGLQQCPECLTGVRTDLFNTFSRPLDLASTGELVQIQGQAECFFHPGKKAVAACTDCGRLLCALCEVAFDGRSICIGCLQTGRSKGRITDLEDSRFLYDSLALYLAFLPLFIFFITIVTAPAAVYVVLRYWNAPTSVLPRTRYRFGLALLIAIAQIAGWVIFFGWFFSR
jgi:B-box zinc finger